MSHVKISKVHPTPSGNGYEFFVAHGDTAREAREQVEAYEAKITRRRINKAHRQTLNQALGGIYKSLGL